MQVWEGEKKGERGRGTTQARRWDCAWHVGRAAERGIAQERGAGWRQGGWQGLVSVASVHLALLLC